LEEETTIWQIFSRTWCLSNNLRIGIKEQWTSQWSPITIRWTLFRPFRIWPPCNNTMTETTTTTTVTRTPYYCNNYSKRSVSKITRVGHTPQTCQLFPGSSNLHCLRQMRDISNRLLSRSRTVLLVEIWHLENQMVLSNPRWHSQLCLLTTNLQRTTTPEPLQREICWSLWSTKLETRFTIITAPVLQTTEKGWILKSLKPDPAESSLPPAILEETTTNRL